MKHVNWNNLRETPIGHLVALFRALEYNQYVTEVNIGKRHLVFSSIRKKFFNFLKSFDDFVNNQFKTYF